jgi:steroid delta-isomerase-like uncharacterized protein
MDRCNELCTKEATGQCALCEALAERERFIRWWMKGGFLREGWRAMQPSTARRAEAHKTLVRRYIAAVWHQGQPESLEELLAPTFVQHLSHTAADGGHEIQGPDGARREVAAWRSAFPDLHFTLEDLLVEGDRVVARWTCSGTHRGMFRELAPTGKRVTFTGMTLYRLAEGKIAEQWTVEDGIGLYQQLGLLRA